MPKKEHLGQKLGLVASTPSSAVHIWDFVTEYCIKCGASHEDFLGGIRVKCDEVGNVIGISHRIALAKIGVKVDGSSSGEQPKPA